MSSGRASSAAVMPRRASSMANTSHQRHDGGRGKVEPRPVLAGWLVRHRGPGWLAVERASHPICCFPRRPHSGDVSAACVSIMFLRQPLPDDWKGILCFAPLSVRYLGTGLDCGFAVGMMDMRVGERRPYEFRYQWRWGLISNIGLPTLDWGGSDWGFPLRPSSCTFSILCTAHAWAWPVSGWLGKGRSA